MKNQSAYQAPTYLAPFVTYDSTTYFQDLIEIEWRGQIQSTAKGKQFKIKYCGKYADDIALIVDQEDYPVLVYAEAIDSQEQILLFDYAKHGYDAMFCDEYEEAELNKRQSELQLLDVEGETLFEVLVYAYHNIDYEEEMEDFLNEANQIELITGELITPEDLKRNGFDFFGIDVIDANGNRKTIVEFELA